MIKTKAKKRACVRSEQTPFLTSTSSRATATGKAVNVPAPAASRAAHVKDFPVGRWARSQLPWPSLIFTFWVQIFIVVLFSFSQSIMVLRQEQIQPGKAQPCHTGLWDSHKPTTFLGTGEAVDSESQVCVLLFPLTFPTWSGKSQHEDTTCCLFPRKCLPYLHLLAHSGKDPAYHSLR